MFDSLFVEKPKAKVKPKTKAKVSKPKDQDHHYSDARDERVKDTGEVFTPPELINEMLDELDYDWDKMPDRTFLDPTCGSGNFLVELAKRGVHPKNIFGVDLMQDNVDKTKERLAEIFKSQKKHYKKHLENNIKQGDALTFDYLGMLPGRKKDNLENW